MPLAAVHRTIAAWFNTSFGALHPTVKIAWANAKRPGKTEAPFIRYSVQPVTSRAYDLGEPRKLDDIEQVVVEIFVLGGEGDALLDDIVDDIRNLFATVAKTPATVGGALFGDTSPNTSRVVDKGPDPEAGSLFKAIVIAPFRFEHTA